MSGHSLTWSQGWWTMHCDEPLDAPCHRRFTCDCETYGAFGMEDGIPYHLVLESPEDDEETRHHGVIDRDFCNHCEWFNEADGQENLGAISGIPVVAQWDADHYDFYPEPTDIGALLKQLDLYRNLLEEIEVIALRFARMRETIPSSRTGLHEYSLGLGLAQAGEKILETLFIDNERTTS